MTAEDYYKLGNEHRRKGDWKHEAKQMLDDILAYRCKDMYNP